MRTHWISLALLWLPQLSCTPREEKAVELLEGIAEAFESHGESQCDALANRLDELVAADQEALAALAESDANKEARKRSAKYQTRIDRAFGTIVEHAPKCGAEPRVAKVLEKLM